AGCKSPRLAFRAGRVQLSPARKGWELWNLSQLPLQRSGCRAGPESEPVRRGRHAVADVSKAVAVRRTELQLIFAVGLEREAEAKRRACRVQPLSNGEGDARGVDCPPRELGEALLRLGRWAGGSQHRQDAPTVVPHRPVE